MPFSPIIPFLEIKSITSNTISQSPHWDWETGIFTISKYLHTKCIWVTTGEKAQLNSLTLGDSTSVKWPERTAAVTGHTGKGWLWGWPSAGIWDLGSIGTCLEFWYTPDGLAGRLWCIRHKRLRFDPWVRKIPWRRKWQPTPVFLPGEPHRQRSLADCGPWGHKETDTEWLSMYAHTQAGNA